MAQSFALPPGTKPVPVLPALGDLRNIDCRLHEVQT